MDTLSTIISRSIRSLKLRGLGPTIRLALFAVARVGRGSTTDLGRQLTLEAFEREHGVDIGGFIELRDLDIASPNKHSGVRYGATTQETFRQLIDTLPILYHEFTFVDFGSGKGAVLLYASEYPFKEVVGVEFSPELNEIAERNLACYRSTSRKCHRVTALCIDAAAYDLPPGSLVLYFNVPFGAAVWKVVLKNLDKAIQESPYNGYLVFLNYGWDHEAALLVDRASFLRCIVNDGAYRIYEFGGSSKLLVAE